MKILKAHYIDEKHDSYFDIIDSESGFGDGMFTYEIDGIKFHCCGFEEFELVDINDYENAKEKFSLLKLGENNNYEILLQRYEIEIDMPFAVENITKQQMIPCTIHIAYKSRKRTENDRNNVIAMFEDERVYLDVFDVSDFSLHIDDEVYSSGINDLNFETNLIKIYNQIRDKYNMPCCFTCQYSDYSPYGNSDFGTMLCYRKHKNEYLKVNDKMSFFKYVEDLSHETKQETSLCEEYAPRTKSEGYRGFI